MTEGLCSVQHPINIEATCTYLSHHATLFHFHFPTRTKWPIDADILADAMAPKTTPPKKGSTKTSEDLANKIREGFDRDQKDYEMTHPVLPYGHGDNANSGYSGSDTSRERAQEADSSGKTGERQALALRMLTEAGSAGLTVHEFDRGADLHHHGKASGVLSNLHLAHKIARIKERRDKCEVYVMPEHVDGREISLHAQEKRAAKTASS